jgi:hypothetical protein
MIPPPCLFKFLTFLLIFRARCAISNGAGRIGSLILLAQCASVRQSEPDPSGQNVYGSTSVADHFGKLDPDPHQHQSEKQDPDLHQSENVEALEGHFEALEGPNLEKIEW